LFEIQFFKRDVDFRKREVALHRWIEISGNEMLIFASVRSFYINEIKFRGSEML